MRLLRLSISAKITAAFVLIVAALVSGMAANAYGRSRDALENATFSQLVSTAAEKEAALNAWVDERGIDLASVAASPRMLELASGLTGPGAAAATSSILAEMRARMSANSSLLTMSILDPDTGEVIVSTDATEVGKSRENLPYFLNGRIQPYVQAAYFPMGAEKPMMAGSAPLRAADGRLLGVLAASLDVGRVDAIVGRRSGMQTTDDAYLVNRSSLLVTQPRLTPDAAVLKYGIQSVAVSRVLTGSNGIVAAADYRGVPVLDAYRWLPSLQLGLVVKIDQAEAYAPARALRSTFGVAAVVALVAAALLAFWLVRLITVPVRRLVRVASDIGAGDLDAHLDTRLSNRSGDEMGQLAQAFSSMAANLKTTVVSRDRLALEVAERVRAQASLQTSERRYQTLVDLSPDAVLVNADGRIVFANSAALRLFGAASPQELVGTPIAERVHPDYRALVARRRAKALAGFETEPAELRFLRVDGSPVDVEVAAARVEFDGRVASQVILRDITERKQAEQALKKSEEQLRQSQKMEAVGQLAGGIAHDFNNLLTAILGYSQMILSGTSPALAEVRDDVEEIKRAAERAGALTRQILAFSRRQVLRPEAVSLNDVIGGMESLLARTLGEDIFLAFTRCSDLGLAEIDRHQFEQVLMNLSVNARDAMPSGGRLTLETANIELDEEYCRAHPEVSPGSYVSLSVVDTGVGMDSETMTRAFEPFFTTKGVGAGTGLGLAVIHGIVAQSHGSIVVFSELGKGTTFKIHLPRVGQPDVAEPGILPHRASARGTETLMVVEDEAGLRGLVERILRGAGYTAIVFGSPDEALEALDEAERVVDLLITDVVLPGALQGPELARAALLKRPGLRILFMSGYTRDALVIAGRLEDGVTLLEKPFSPEGMETMVRAVLERGSDKT